MGRIDPRGPLGALAATVLVALALPAAAPAQAPYDDWNPELPGFPSNTDESPRANCAGGSDQCIDRTIGEMWRRFHTVIPSCEHNNVFSLTYLRVTEDIREAVDIGFYDDLQWINQQDAMFARVYFLAYDNWAAGRTALVPESWRVAFNSGRDESVQGIGNLLLSMNAHVNRDFPFILDHVGLTNPDGSSKKPDHDAYNERLRALYQPMLAELAERFDESIDDYDVPGVTVDDDAFFELLVQWRESAWQNAERLANAEGDAERRAVAGEIEDYANRWAETILAGSRYRPGEDAGARNARCAEHGGQRPDYRRGTDVARPGPLAALDRPGSLRVRVGCPDGAGPCLGRVSVRRPRRAGARGPGALELLGGRRFAVRAGASWRLRVPIARARSLRRHPERGAWIAARSKLGPGIGFSERHKAKLR